MLLCSEFSVKIPIRAPMIEWTYFFSQLYSKHSGLVMFKLHLKISNKYIERGHGWWPNENHSGYSFLAHFWASFWTVCCYYLCTIDCIIVVISGESSSPIPPRENELLESFWFWTNLNSSLSHHENAIHTKIVFSYKTLCANSFGLVIF